MKKVPVILVIVSGCLLIALQSKGNTITTGALSASALCTGSNLKVPFTVSGTYNTGNIFTAQLSDANGSFASAVNIGTLSGITDDTIVATIPAGTLPGTGYRIRVVAANPAVTGSDNGGNLVISTGSLAWNYVDSAAFAWSGGNIILGSDGTPFVVYSDSSSNGNGINRLSVKKFNGTQWVQVGTRGLGMPAGNSQANPQIAMAQNGTLYVAFGDGRSNGDVISVVKFNGTDWVLVGQAGLISNSSYYSVSLPSSLAIDGDSTPYVAYVTQGVPFQLTVMKFDGNGWVQVGPLSDFPGNTVGASLLIGANNIPYISYGYYPGGFGANLEKGELKKFNGINWVSIAPNNVNRDGHLAKDDHDTLYLAYVDDKLGYKLSVLKFNGTSWVPVGQPGFSGNAGDASVSPPLAISSFAIDHNGTPYAAYEENLYYNGTGGYLGKATVMKFDGINWVTVGPRGFTQGYANYVHVAIDPNNTPYIFFGDYAYYHNFRVPGTVMKYSNLGNITGNNIIGNQSGCIGFTPIALSGSDPSGGTGTYTYLWESSTDSSNFIAAAGTNNGQNYSPAALAQPTWYKRVVTSGCSIENSTSVKIAINPGTISNNTITADQTVCAGSVPAALTGSLPAGGNGTYVYQWQSSIDNINYTAAAGTNVGQNYMPATLTQTTWFKRTVNSGGTCADISPSVAITIAGLVAANTISSDQVICTGTTPVTITGSTPSGGTGTYTYQWQSSTDNTSYTTAAGTNTGQNYTPGSLTQTTWFRRTVTSGSGSCAAVISTAVKIAINPIVNNNTITADQSICAGSVPATLNGSVPSGGDGVNYSYQWQISTDNISFSNISGANSSNCSPQSIYQTTWYKRIVSSGGCSNTSTSVAITIAGSVSGNTISSDQAICTGTAPSAIIGSTPSGGNGTYTYQWQSSTDNTSYTTAAGTNTGQNYTPGSLTQTTWFRRAVTSGSGSCAAVNSTAVKITINPIINNNTITADQSICAGSVPAALNGSAPSGGDGVSYSYQWQSSIDNNTFSNINGATNSNYGPSSINQTTWFKRIVSSGGCAHTSTTVAITIVVSVTNNTIASDQAVCTGTAPSALTGSTPSGGNGTYIYQWQSSTDNTSYSDITGATNSNYNPSSVTQTTWFRRTVTSGNGNCATVFSTAVKITINPIINNNTITADQSICEGSIPAALNGSVPSGGDGVSYSYQWQSSTDNNTFANISGATNSNYSPPSINQTTWFIRTVNSGGCTHVSTVVAITIDDSVTNNTIGSDQVVCSGTTPSPFTVSIPSGGANGTFAYYQWQSSIDNTSFIDIAGAIYNNYVPTAITQITWFRRVVKLGNSGCPSNISKAVMISVKNCTDILIPNVFSPNGDGINDTWVIGFLSGYPNCKVEVFNRGGSQIFVSTGYPKPWDGNYKGKPVPFGMYYYVIDLRNGTMPVSGSVLIIK